MDAGRRLLLLNILKNCTTGWSWEVLCTWVPIDWINQDYLVSRSAHYSVLLKYSLLTGTSILVYSLLSTQHSSVKCVMEQGDQWSSKVCQSVWQAPYQFGCTRYICTYSTFQTLHLAPPRAEYEQAFAGVNLNAEKISGALFEVSGALSKALATLKFSGPLFEVWGSRFLSQHATI